MRIQRQNGIVRLWISARDTRDWASRLWPCSALAGHRVYAEFDKAGDPVDVRIDGRGTLDCPADEFRAITGDFLSSRE